MYVTTLYWTLIHQFQNSSSRINEIEANENKTQTSFSITLKLSINLWSLHCSMFRPLTISWMKMFQSWGLITMSLRGILICVVAARSSVLYFSSIVLKCQQEHWVLGLHWWCYWYTSRELCELVFFSGSWFSGSCRVPTCGVLFTFIRSPQ